MKRVLSVIVFSCAAVAAMAQNYRNPIIPGYHPDPSICRVGDDFYLVNSSFEYFPGVPISHSKDLVHWEQIGNVLDRDSQLPLKGTNSWLGIYAPTIRYNDGTYYMITTNVGNGGNFLVTAKDPKGPWSEPVWLQQQGIDPSLYFENGKCYMVSNPDNTIMLCEIDPKTGKQLTDSKPLWQGTGGRYPEGPHIYKKDGYYYLLISEGGTELAHHLTIARSKKIDGPYKGNPDNPILTNCNMKGQSMQIQGTGHGDFVQAADGSWWIVFLAYRNYGGSYHHLGRETYLAPVVWEKGKWPVVNGGNPVDTLMSARLLPEVKLTRSQSMTTFENGMLGHEWIYLQNPIRESYKFANKKLTLTTHGTLTDNNQPTFVGRRQENASILAETCIDLKSISEPSAMSDALFGLTVYQINDGHIDLCTDGSKVKVKCRLKTLSADCGEELLPIKDGAETGKLKLRITSDGNNYHFLYACDNGPFKELSTQSCTLVSTETAGGFTGVVLGMYAEGNTKSQAAFEYFNYEEK